MRRGFTLIETIVYLGLFALVMSGIVVSAYALFETAGRNQAKASLQEERDFLVAKINYVLSGVSPSQAIVPSANSSGSTLTATTYGNGTNTINLSGISSGNLQLNGVALNNTNVTISNLVFIHTYAGGTNPESIEAGFTISGPAPNGMTISETASTTRYIRK